MDGIFGVEFFVCVFEDFFGFFVGNDCEFVVVVDDDVVGVDVDVVDGDGDVDGVGVLFEWFLWIDVVVVYWEFYFGDFVVVVVCVVDD